jgi:N-acetylmuramoyl-L-alanine amidase
MDDPSATARSEIANAFGADLVISLQTDSYPNEKAHGVATFYFGSETGNSSLTGETLSGYIQREIAARTDFQNCGTHARTWDLLRLTQAPTVELVAGYLSNPGDVSRLTDPAVRDAVAEAVVVAVKRLYLLDRDDQPTGTYKFSELLRAELG